MPARISLRFFVTAAIVGGIVVGYGCSNHSVAPMSSSNPDIVTETGQPSFVDTIFPDTTTPPDTIVPPDTVVPPDSVRPPKDTLKPPKPPKDTLKPPKPPKDSTKGK